MRWSRGTVVLTAVGAGVALAACGGSSKVAGPTRPAVVTTIDSQYTKDTAAHGNSGVLDGFILLSVDEGAVPTNVSVATDSGPLAMQLIGATLYDTAGGQVTDSLMLTVAWPQDFSVYLITLVTGVVGEVLTPRPRISVSSHQLAALRARFRFGARQVGVTPAGDTASIGLLQSATDSVATPDSITVALSEAPAAQGCVYQHITFANAFFVNDSTALCNRVTITQSFALHFPPTFGVSARFAHMAMSPAQTAQAARLALTAP
jgi:hypothetical protein